MTIRYDEVKKGDTVLVSRDSNTRTKREAVVAGVEIYPTRYNDIMVQVTLEDGDVHYGWSNRELERL